MLFAVRSSGIDKDSAASSLPSVHESLLNMDAWDIPEVVWNSYYRPGAVMVRVRRGDFSANPLAGFDLGEVASVYAISSDHSIVLDGRAALRERELAYLHTRSILPVDEADGLWEPDEIAIWLGGFLARSGITNSRCVYSKLSLPKEVAGSAQAAT